LHFVRCSRVFSVSLLCSLGTLALLSVVLLSAVLRIKPTFVMLRIVMYQCFNCTRVLLSPRSERATCLLPC